MGNAADCQSNCAGHGIDTCSYCGICCFCNYHDCTICDAKPRSKYDASTDTEVNLIRDIGYMINNSGLSDSAIIRCLSYLVSKYGG